MYNVLPLVNDPICIYVPCSWLRWWVSPQDPMTPQMKTHTRECVPGGGQWNLGWSVHSRNHPDDSIELQESRHGRPNQQIQHDIRAIVGAFRLVPFETSADKSSLVKGGGTPRTVPSGRIGKGVGPVSCGESSSAAMAAFSVRVSDPLTHVNLYQYLPKAKNYQPSDSYKQLADAHSTASRTIYQSRYG